MQDNTSLTLDAAQVVGMSVALAQYSNSLHQIAGGLRDNIFGKTNPGVETAVELATIEWPL
jgi:hypothetical protein